MQQETDETIKLFGAYFVFSLENTLIPDYPATDFTFPVYIWGHLWENVSSSEEQKYTHAHSHREQLE